MKTSRRISIAAVSLATSVLAVSASIADSQETQGVKVIESQILTVNERREPTLGMVTFDTTSAPPSGKITTYKIRGLPGSTTEQVGGGTWTYGWNLINASTRQCFSRYIHRSKSHTATAIMGGVTRSSTARSESWASAEVVGELTSGTCNAYWSTQ